MHKLDSSGELIEVIGKEECEAGSDPGQFWSPVDLAVGADGSLYVLDKWNHRVQKFGFTADLALTKSVITEEPTRREPLEYLITVTNQGLLGAMGVTVEDTLTRGARFMTLDPSCSRSDDKKENKVICTLGELTAGETKTLTLKVKSGAKRITNEACVKATEPEDPDSSNDCDKVVTILAD